MAKDGHKLTDGAKGKKLLKNLVPIAGSKKLATDEDKSNLSFSFQYFQQIKYFQLGDQDNKWYLSLLERLKDLSGKGSNLMADVTAKKKYRLHPINWGQPRIPIQKDDLDWVPEEYRKSEDIEFQQFEITKSNGRVVGFFNETNEIFYIVLLDPKHNIQPTKDTGYRVDDTYEGLTDYEELLIQIKKDKVDSKHCARAEQMIWMDEELINLFMKFGIEDWKERLEEILMEEI